MNDCELLPQETEEPPSEPPLQIGLVFNCKHPDRHDDAEAEYDSIETVQAIAAALASAGHTVHLIEAGRNFAENLKGHHLDLVFNIAEGRQGRGRESEAPAIFNLLDIPFVGSDETALAIAMDKALCKRLLSTYGVRSPRGEVCSATTAVDQLDLHFPLIIKPDAEGSSKGIPNGCIAKSKAELKKLLQNACSKYGSRILAEEYVAGREFTVGIIGNGAEAKVFPPMEIAFKETVTSPFHVYSYDIKQDYKKYIQYLCPAPLTKEQDDQMRAMALTAFNALGCNDFARADFRMDDEGNIYFIEINPLPGLAPNYSDFPMLAEFVGVGYQELILQVLHAGMKRLGIGQWSKK